MHKPILVILFLGILAMGMPSCVNMRKLQYMQGTFDTAAMKKVDIPAVVIQKNDVLGIVVYSDNPAATVIFNQSQVSGSSGSSASAPQGSGGGGNAGGVGFGGGGSNPSSGGYLVDREGNIQFQGLGTVRAEGLTIGELREQLDSSLKRFLQNPYTTVRFLNYKVTVIGDVAHPAVYTIPNERVNLLEALGLAGDLNITARRDNVLIIREQNGERSFGRIDLTRPDIFTSPYFQLKQNDVIYVDFTKGKAATADQTTLRNITIATSLITTLILVITVFKQ
ncbi:MAG TPA: polysaccharide biosynthesis/export family protein [Puia sp.]|jgi:polysaccharide export outer membrane protein|nr:polysaccharide biosynthesis/export family protein [Puia sp.]